MPLTKYVVSMECGVRDVGGNCAFSLNAGLNWGKTPLGTDLVVLYFLL